MIAGAMETRRLPIHVRFIFCNLNEASVRVLANSLLDNSSLIGFTCLFHPCMVEERSKGLFYHAPTSSAAQCVRAAVIRTRAPLEIWNNEKLKEDVVTERKKFQANRSDTTNSSVVTPHISPLDEDFELEQLARKMEELKRSKEKKRRENEEKLKEIERQLVQLSRSEKDFVTKLESMKNSKAVVKKELESGEVELKQIQAKVTEFRSTFNSLQDNINKETQKLLHVRTQITESKLTIDRLKASLGQKISESGSKQLQEDLDFQKAKATSLEEASEIMKEEIDLQVNCNICNERQKNLVIQCGHRTCNICLDEWRKKNDACPFCKATIQQVIRLFN